MSVKSIICSESKEIAGYSFDEYREIVKEFHGSEAPGLLIGGFMVALALQNLEEGGLYDAIGETRTCLPDAIQLLTPCTIGNGWLKVVPFGRYALTLYDKTDASHPGVRVYVDAAKLKAWPEIYAWFFKLKTKGQEGQKNLTEHIRQAGTSILSISRVSVNDQFAKKLHKGKIDVCQQCGEAYPAADGKSCLACQGNIVYS